MNVRPLDIVVLVHDVAPHGLRTGDVPGAEWMPQTT
jgi:hypothetical protein